MRSIKCSQNFRFQQNSNGKCTFAWRFCSSFWLTFMACMCVQLFSILMSLKIVRLFHKEIMLYVCTAINGITGFIVKFYCIEPHLCSFKLMNLKGNKNCGSNLLRRNEKKESDSIAITPNWRQFADCKEIT